MIKTVVFNMKKRTSGVSSTIFALQPILESMRSDIAYYGSHRAQSKSKLCLIDLFKLCFLSTKENLVFHLRRDHEITFALFLKWISRRKIKLVFTWAAQRPKGRFSSWLTTQCDAIITTSIGAAQYAPFSTVIIPHGVNTHLVPTRFPEKSLSVIKIALIGRIRKEKGTDIFIKALLGNLDYNFEAYIVGEAIGQRNKEFKYDLQNIIDQSGAKSRFKWIDSIAYQDMGEFLSKVHVVVACPRYEAFGLTLFEGAAAGCAIIGSRTGAFPDLIGQNERGLLVQCGSINDLTSAIAKFLSNPEFMADSAQKARDYVKSHFSLEREARDISALYNNLLEKT